jgi:hypothetical protein
MPESWLLPIATGEPGTSLVRKTRGNAGTGVTRIICTARVTG